MFRILLKSKVHRATVTHTNLHYEGSLTVDSLLLEAAQILPFEQVMVSNLHNGERFETYVMPGEKGSGVLCLNGPTARKGTVGDAIIIFCYAYYDEAELKPFSEQKPFQPIVVEVDEKNQITKIRRGGEL